MENVTLNHWSPGVKVVSLIELVRKHTSLSLSESKQRVESFLGGNPMTLSFQDVAAKEEFRHGARYLGIVMADS